MKGGSGSTNCSRLFDSLLVAMTVVRTTAAAAVAAVAAVVIAVESSSQGSEGELFPSKEPGESYRMR